MPTHFTKAHFGLSEGDQGEVSIAMDGADLVGIPKGSLYLVCRKGTSGQKAKEIAHLLNQHVSEVAIQMP